MDESLQNYHARMLRVLKYIDRNLDNDLNLESLSKIAAFSKFHFHRQFTATFSLSVHRYVQLARMKRASYQLAWKDGDSVTDIAMDAGYDSPDAFGRAFRQRFGQSPSSFRKSPDWHPWMSALLPLDNARNRLMKIIFDHEDVTIRDVPATRVAIMEHRGDRATIGATVERFKLFCKRSGLSPESGRPSFMIFRSERCPENPADYSVDLCIGTEQPIIGDDNEVKVGEIPGGRCAVLRYPGNTNNLEPAATYLYRDWLPGSGHEVRDFPIYSQRRLGAIPNASAHDVILELFLPIR